MAPERAVSPQPVVWEARLGQRDVFAAPPPPASAGSDAAGVEAEFWRAGSALQETDSSQLPPPSMSQARPRHPRPARDFLEAGAPFRPRRE